MTLRDELTRRQSHTDRVAAYFTARPWQWISTAELEREGGRNAWRTRVSDCRMQLGLTIENRQRRVGGAVVSEYRFVPRPADPLGPDASQDREQRLFS